MHAEAACARSFAAVVLVFGTTLACAFEPGTTRVCVPSADGSRFECRDKNATAPAAAPRAAKAPIDPAASDRAEPPAASDATNRTDERAPVTAPAAIEPATTPESARSARELPNYLRQNPVARDASAETTVAPEATTPAATTDSAAPAPEVETPAPAARVPEGPRATSAPAVDAAEAVRTREPIASDETDVEHAPPEPAAAGRAPASQAAPSAAPTRAPSSRTADAQAFRRLAGNRYTLEIARARSANEFGALIAALPEIDGTLYVIGLRNPQGTSYSLVWSDFPSIEVAREALASLPADVAITSGWPRRIGPLQAELIGP